MPSAVINRAVARNLSIAQQDLRFALQFDPEAVPAAQAEYSVALAAWDAAAAAQAHENAALIRWGNARTIVKMLGKGWETQSGEPMSVVAARLRRGGRSLIPLARRNVRAVAAPAIAAVRANARATLPHRGGLNNWVATGRFTVSLTTGTRTAGVTIRGTKTGHDLRAIDRGLARHPTRSGPQFRYTNREAWRTTDVEPGFFTRPMRAMAPPVRAAMLAAMNETIRIAGFE